MSSSTAAAAAPGLEWRRQPFDTEHLGAPAGRLLVAPEGRGEALRRTLPGLTQAWRQAGLWLVSCRLPAEWDEDGRHLQDAGFRPIERLATYERAIEPVPDGPVSAVPAGAGDLAAAVEIGRRAFTYDRYHADPEVPNARADALKAAWVRNAFAGRADAVLVVRVDGRAAGFVLCMRDGEAAIIDLIAVAEESRGRGLGRALVAGALGRYAGKAARMRVSTQTTNLASIRLYEAMGFARASEAGTYHWTDRAAGR